MLDQIEAFDLHSHDGKRLEQKGQCRLAACKTGVQECDTGNDEPNQEGHYDQIKVVEFKSRVLSVDILNVGVAAIGLRLIEFRLLMCQQICSDAQRSRCI